MSPEAQHYINLLSPYIHAYGYLVAFFGMMLENAGIPVPAESALIVLSFFAAQGALKIWLVIPIAVLGDAAGDNLGFMIGRLGGRPLVEKYGHYIRINKAKLDAMERLFKDRGGRTVFTAHFFSTTRITAALIAGISHMRYRRFLEFNLAAAATFVTLVATVTFYFGRNLDATLSFFHAFRVVGLAVAAAVISVYVYRHLREKGVYRHLGVKVIAGATTMVLALWLLIYTISGLFVVLPRTGPGAGLATGRIAGADVSVERGFISAASGNNLLVTALGEPTVRFSRVTQPAFVVVTIRNVRAGQTALSAGPAGHKAVALDALTLSVGVNLVPGKPTKVVASAAGPTRPFDFAAAGDTRDAGPLFPQIISSVDGHNPAFLLHAGDFVKDGEKKKYLAFLDQSSGLQVPLYTALGAHEVLDRGEPVYRKLFGPPNYTFSDGNATFIVLDSSKESTAPISFGWLASQLGRARPSANIFVLTYATPFDSTEFTALMTKAHVKAVFSVKATGPYSPLLGGVRYDLLEHEPGKGYAYRLVHVSGRTVTDRGVQIVPRGLGVVDKIVLFLEDLKRRILSPLGR